MPLAPLQGDGLGARLIDMAMRNARAVRARRVLLGVHGENATAHAVYARQGYAQAGVRKCQVGANTCEDLVLARVF